MLKSLMTSVKSLIFIIIHIFIGILSIVSAHFQIKKAHYLTTFVYKIISVVCYLVVFALGITLMLNINNFFDFPQILQEHNLMNVYFFVHSTIFISIILLSYMAVTLYTKKSNEKKVSKYNKFKAVVLSGFSILITFTFPILCIYHDTHLKSEIQLRKSLGGAKKSEFRETRNMHQQIIDRAILLGTKELLPLAAPVIKKGTKELIKDIISIVAWEVFAHINLKEMWKKAKFMQSFDLNGTLQIADLELAYEISCGLVNSSCKVTHVPTGIYAESKTKTFWSLSKMKNFYADTFILLFTDLFKKKLVLTPAVINFFIKKLIEKGWTLDKIMTHLKNNNVSIHGIYQPIKNAGWTLPKIRDFILKNKDKGKRGWFW